MADLVNIQLMDSAVKAQFLKKDDLIERGGHTFRVVATSRSYSLVHHDMPKVVWVDAWDLDTGLWAEFSIHFDVWVILGTEIEVPADHPLAS